MIQQRTYSWDDDHSEMIRLAATDGGVEVFRRAIDQQLTLGAFEAGLGIELTGIGDGEGRARCVLKAFHGTWLGLVPCGLLSSLGMAAAVPAAVSRLAPAEGVFPGATSLDLLQQPAAINDELCAVAVVQSEDRPDITVGFTICATDGAEVATGTVNFTGYRR